MRTRAGVSARCQLISRRLNEDKTNSNTRSHPKYFFVLNVRCAKQAISFQQNGNQFEQESCKRVCFFNLDSPTNDEAQSISGGGKIRHLNQINGDLCTHLVLYHVRGESNGAIVLSSDEHLHFFKEVREFKLRYKHLRVMVAVLINLTDWSEPDVR